jgi:NADH-quinone oxidoreductase subunit N
LAGIARTKPFLALAAAVFLFSLAGLPPLPGFWGKFAVFSGAVKVGLSNSAEIKLQSWFIITAVVGMLNAAISAGYYLRLIGAMYFRPATSDVKPSCSTVCTRLATVVCLVASLSIAFAPGPLSTASIGASKGARILPVAAATQQASR